MWMRTWILGLGLVSAAGAAPARDHDAAPLIAPALRPGSAAGWRGDLVRHGNVREVMGMGRHRPRVRLGDLTETPGFFGLGALAGIRGEVTILDGEIFISRVGPGRRLVPVTRWPEIRWATLMVGATVPAWEEEAVPRDLSGDDLEAYVAGRAEAAGLDAERPFPFLIEGAVRDLRLHVVNGACPMRLAHMGEPDPVGREPFREHREAAEVRILGFYARGRGGDLTHHGVATHTHVVLAGPRGSRYTGHVESVSVSRGATLRLPAGRPGQRTL